MDPMKCWLVIEAYDELIWEQVSEWWECCQWWVEIPTPLLGEPK